MNHALNNTLSNHRRTKLNRHKFINLRHNILVKTNELVITTSVSAFTNHSLGNGVQRSKFNLIVLAWLGLLEITKTLFERVEFTDEDVGLVYFVCKHNQFLLSGEFEDISDLFFAERGTSWIARVDDGNGTGVNAFFVCLLESRLDALETCTPACGFIKVVGDAVCVKNGEGGGVEGVLWDWDEDTSLWCRADDVEEGVHAAGSTGGEVDEVWVGRVAISS